jgi:hypothetical protein
MMMLLLLSILIIIIIILIIIIVIIIIVVGFTASTTVIDVSFPQWGLPPLRVHSNCMIAAAAPIIPQSVQLNTQLIPLFRQQLIPLLQVLYSSQRLIESSFTVWVRASCTSARERFFPNALTIADLLASAL